MEREHEKTLLPARRVGDRCGRGALSCQRYRVWFPCWRRPRLLWRPSSYHQTSSALLGRLLNDDRPRRLTEGGLLSGPPFLWITYLAKCQDQPSTFSIASARLVITNGFCNTGCSTNGSESPIWA